LDSVVVLSDKVLDPDIVPIAFLLYMLMISVARVLCIVGIRSWNPYGRRYDLYFDYCAALGVGLGAHRLLMRLGLVMAS